MTLERSCLQGVGTFETRTWHLNAQVDWRQMMVGHGIARDRAALRRRRALVAKLSNVFIMAGALAAPVVPV